jgi:phosphate butyryltransferase
MFRHLDELVEAARALGPVRIAIAAAHDPDVIEAMRKARDIGLAEGYYVGNAHKILELARSVDLEIPNSRLIHEPDDAAAARKAIALVREGTASLLMKGKISTATLARAVLDRETRPAHGDACSVRSSSSKSRAWIG